MDKGSDSKGFPPRCKGEWLIYSSFARTKGYANEAIGKVIRLAQGRTAKLTTINQEDHPITAQDTGFTADKVKLQQGTK